MTSLASIRIALAAAMLPATAAIANEITYQCFPNGPMTVADGAGLDLDPAPDVIRVAIDCMANLGGGNIWRAQGTLVADASVPDNETTTFEDLTIWNESGNIAGGHFAVSHFYGYPTGNHNDVSASVHGHFDNLNAPGFLGGAQLTYSVNVDWGTAIFTDQILAGATPWEFGVAPIPFGSDGLPFNFYVPHRHKLDFIFYLDSPGDAIFFGDGDIEVQTTSAACPEDLDGDLTVGFGDILAILGAWGPCAGCPEDLSGNNVVDFADILAVIAAWGPCP
ncbi:MAG: hypothetical protein ACYTGP_09335 [Planctomycetota bacterium]|jgi:hypothetical protein